MPRPPRIPRETLSVRAQIDRATRQFVKCTRPLLEESPPPVPRDRSIEGHFAEEFYHRATTELESLGFRVLGDFGQGQGDDDLFARLLLSRDGRTAAKILAAPASGTFGAVRAVAFGSAFAHDASVTTWLNWPPRIPSPPQYQEWFVEGDQPLATVLAAHQTHVLRAGQAPRSFTSAEEIHEEWAREERATVAWRREQGLRFYELFLRNVTGERYEESGVVMLEAIRAHPWWLTGGRAA